MINAAFDGTYAGWRSVARALILHGHAPDRIEWVGDSVQQPLLTTADADSMSRGPISSFSVPSDFLRLAECVSCFRDQSRWSLLYRVLWRLTHGEKRLLKIVVDPDVSRLQRMASAIRRDEHKMKAFVRFRRVGEDDESSARYIAWFTPAHLILERVAPFFANRFASMQWSILTPDGSINWNGETVASGPPLDRTHAPAGDELEILWRTYYASVFNPARLKLRAMRSEMPKKYWAGLPEASLIPGLVAGAPKRVREMGVANSREENHDSGF